MCILKQFSTILPSNFQQVVRRYILGSIVESEKNYVDALRRILEVRKHSVAYVINLFLPIVHKLVVYVL